MLVHLMVHTDSMDKQFSSTMLHFSKNHLFGAVVAVLNTGV